MPGINWNITVTWFKHIIANCGFRELYPFDFRQYIGSEINFKKEISEAEDHEAKLLEKEAEYAELFANSYTAAQRGFIDEVILPEDTRRKLLKAFSMLEG